jgi:hypothetical protein
METINTITTQGKKISFKVDGVYYTKVNKDELFGGEFNQGCKYCVAYTTIKHDEGWRTENRFGAPSIERYDNGIVGYQNFNFFEDKETAVTNYNDLKKLSPKIGVIGYADVFLFEKE